LPNQILPFLKKYAYYYGHIAGKTLDLNPDSWFKSEVFNIKPPQFGRLQNPAGIRRRLGFLRA
jgi:hypothetical protein